MRKLALAGGVLLFFGTAANAGEIQSVITDSVQLTVNGASVTSTVTPTTYAVSGSGIDATTFGGTSQTQSGATASITAGDYDLSEDGAAFTFSESISVGQQGATTQAVDATLGTFDSVTTFGNQTVIAGGTAGDLAGTLDADGVPTLTAGGQGTTALGQRTMSLSVFD